MNELEHIKIKQGGTETVLDVMDNTARTAASTANSAIDQASSLELDESQFTIDDYTEPSEVRISIKGMQGATETADGTAGLVPAPTKAEKDKVLSGTGSWVSLPTVPTAVSSFTNDAGYITVAEVPASEVKHDDTMSGTGASDDSKLSVKTMVGAKVMSYDPAVLGGVEYAGHKVGDQLWTGAIAYPTSNSKWYNNDKATYEAYGLYYVFSDTETINAQLNDGWRVPTRADINKLISTVGSSNYLKVLSVEDGGTDDYGLGWRLGGYADVNIGTRGRYWTSTPTGPCNLLISGSLETSTNAGESTNMNIVLVKDVIADTDGTKGLVPQPKVADVDKFLKGDGTWDTPYTPTKTSELTNDSGFITSADIPANTVYHDSTMTGDGATAATKLSVNTMVGAQDYGIGGTMKVSGRSYPFKKIGNLLWTTRNIGVVDAVPIRTNDNYDTYGSSAYYEYDSTDDARCGLLFNALAVGDFSRYISDGWRIPTKEDFEELFATIGGKDNEHIDKLKFVGTSTDKVKWSNDEPISDEYGFSAMPTGYRYNSRSFSGRNSATCFWCAYNTYSSTPCVKLDTTSASFSTGSYSTYYSIRLCKTYVEGGGKDGTGGLVPTPTGSDAMKALRGDGTWATLPTKTSELTNNSGFISAPTLTTVDTSSWGATATLTLDSTHFNVISVPSTTTSLTLETPSSTSIEAYSLQLTVSSDTTTINFTYGGNPCKLAGAPDSWDPAATYQITIVNGCAAIGAFE